MQETLPDDLMQVEVDGAGFNLHWPTPDVDLYVSALVAGIFGTRKWMTQMLARRRAVHVAGEDGCRQGQWRKRRSAAQGTAG